MSIAPLLYFDNSLLRELIDNPIYWNDIHDILVPRYGGSYQPRRSLYLFIEYFGLRKILNHSKTKLPFFGDIKSTRQAEEKIDEITKRLEEYFDNLRKEFQQQLATEDKEQFIKKQIKERVARESKFEGSQELVGDLFGVIIDKINSDFSFLIKRISVYLAWDYFCNIPSPGFDLSLFRQIQLGQWNRIRENGTILPFGKLIDDLSEKYCGISLQKGSCFQGGIPLDDLVDSDAITSIFLEKNIFLTLDIYENIEQRIDLARCIIEKVQQALNIEMTIPMNIGTVICLKKENNKIILANEPIHPSITIVMKDNQKELE